MDLLQKIPCYEWGPQTTDPSSLASVVLKGKGRNTNVLRRTDFVLRIPRFGLLIRWFSPWLVLVLRI